MKRHLLFTSSLALCASLGSAALADITAADVWENQQAYLGSLGLTPTGTLEDGKLVSPQINAVFPAGIASFQISASDLTLTENGDGTVTVSYPSPADITISGFVQDGGNFEIGLVMTHSGYDILASGDPGNITYDSAVDQLRLEIRDFSASEAEGFELAGVVELADMVFQNTINVGNLVTMETEGEIGVGTTQIILTAPDGLVTTTDQTTQPVQTSGTMSLPLGGSDLMNLSQALRDGLSFDFESSGGGSSSETVVSQGGSVISTQSNSVGDQTFTGSFDESGLVLQGEAADFAMLIEDQMMLPMPLDATIGTLSMDYRIPVNASEETQEFKLAFGLNDLELGEGVWSLFDPAGELPRDPAQVELDLSGQGTTGVDFLDFMALSNMSGPPPIEVDNVSLNNLRIAAVGAEAMAEGDMTFDWTDFSTLPGMPRPEGEVEINVSGANMLIDTLIGMGLLTEEDAMGARMMMGIFAEPTGDDTLRSVIEVNEEGHVLANGQRIR